MSVASISSLNAKIGICGVVSTIAAVYEKRPGAQQLINDRTSSRDGSLAYVYEIICGYLSYLQEYGEDEVIQETEAITKSFGGVYANWTVKGYLSRGMREEEKRGGGFAMALTPNGILALLEFLGMRGVNLGKDVPGDAIVGLTRKEAPINRWGNLAHWAYRYSNGTWLNHGTTYDSLEALSKAAGRDYQEIIWISVHG